LRVSIVRPDQVCDPVDVCCVVDVMRATTTASVLCGRFAEIIVARSPAELDRLPGAVDYAVFSELSALTTDLPRFDNSPAIARSVELHDRTPVLVTTNGTIAVDLATRFAREVVLAAFVNLSAVVDHVRRSGVTSVAIMPAGNINRHEHCSEDDGCAHAIAHRLRDEVFDDAAAIATCRSDPRIVRRGADPGLAEDLEICFAIDAVPVVPRVVATHAGWYAVRR
jgi:phosphosulfolactate phosphohydrolase-like enzyme